MAELIKRTPRAVGAVGKSAARGVSATTESVSFELPVLSWSDMPHMRLPRKTYTDLVVDQRGAKRLPDGQLVQTRIGVKAHPSGLLVVEATRPLSRRADGKYAPAGSWSIADNVALVGKPHVGRITAEIRVSGAGSGQEAAGGNVPLAHREAHEAAGYIPAEIVTDVARTIANPRHWLGEVTQQHDGLKQEVKLARTGTTQAVILHASRSSSATANLAHAPWQITRYLYTDTLVPQIGGSR